MRFIFGIALVIVALASMAQRHDTLRTYWVYDTLDLYERDIKDMGSSDTLTLIPLFGSWHRWCCMGIIEPHDGWVLGMHYDYSTAFGIHSGGISVGRFLPEFDMLVELEAQSDPEAAVYDVGLSVWKNMLYIPVASGVLNFPLLRPGIKLGIGHNYGNRYLYYEPKIGLTIPAGRSHLYYAYHKPFDTEYVGGQIWHQLGWSYYFLL